MSPQDRRRDVTRRQVLDAAAVVFAEKGFDGASIDDIVAQAGVARGTVYYNFDSKEAIALCLAARGIAQVDARLRPRLGAAGEDCERLLFDLIGQSCRWFIDNRHLARVVLSAPLRHPAVAATLPTDRPSFRVLARDILAEGQKQGTVRPDIDVTTLAQIVGGVFIQAVLVGIDGEAEALDGWLRSLVRVLIDGMRARED